MDYMHKILFVIGTICIISGVIVALVKKPNDQYTHIKVELKEPVTMTHTVPPGDTDLLGEYYDGEWYWTLIPKKTAEDKQNDR